MGTELNHKIKKGLIWTFVNQAVTQIVFVWFGIVFARMLTPADFGMVGMITVFTNFAVLFVDFGFGAALIQRKEVTQADLSTAFWFNIVIGIALYVVFFFCAGSIAEFYQLPALKPITRILALTFILSSLTSVQSSLLSKKMDFKTKTIISWISIALSYAVALVLAWRGVGIWAIVAQGLLSSSISFLLLWLSAKWKPSFVFSKSSFKQMFGFGSSVVGDSIFNYWSRNFDNLLIAKFLGSAVLGVYSRAYSLMLLPVNNISKIISRVMFPAFSEIQNDKARIASIYLKTTKVIALICFPLMFGLSMTANSFVLLFFGEKWVGMVSMLRWLSILGAFQAILTLNGIIYNALGKAYLAFKLSVVLNIALMTGFFVGLKVNGVMGLVVAYFIVGTFGTIPILYRAIRLIGIGLKDMFLNLRTIFLAAAIMCTCVLLVTHLFKTNSVALFFFTQVFIGVLTYLASLWFIDKELLAELPRYIKKKQSKAVVA